MLNTKAELAVLLADLVVELEVSRKRCSDPGIDCGGSRSLCVVCSEIQVRYDDALNIYYEAPGTPDEAREAIAGKRFGYTQKFKIGGQTLYLRTGEYRDGRLAEIFIDIAKGGATLRGIFSTLAISISLGLQYGVPLQEYVDALVGTKFEPSGPVEGHDEIKKASSLIDMMFHDLALSYGCKVPPPAKTMADASAL